MAEMTRVERTILNNQLVLMQGVRQLLINSRGPGSGASAANLSLQIGYTEGLLQDG